MRERETVKGYLESLEAADQDEELVVKPGKVAEALKKLLRSPEKVLLWLASEHGC